MTALTTRQLAALPESPMPCPDCNRALRVGLEGQYCPDQVHCQFYMWGWGRVATVKDKAA
jgi:hypothetical protein